LKKVLILFLAMAVVAVLGTGPVQAAEETVVIGMDADADSLDPRFNTTAYGMYVVQQIYDGLIELDEELGFENVVAEDFETPSDTEYVFHLREGIKFHDGEELTAEDVKFTYESMLDPDLGSPKAGGYLHLVGAEEFNEGEADEVEGIEVIDDYTISFQLEEPHAPFLVDVTTGIVPKHLAEEAGEEFGDDPVGSGPFVFEEREIDESTTLTAFDDHYQGRPNIDEVRYRVIPEAAVGVVELETGELDVLMSVSEDDVSIIEGDDSLELAATASTNYEYIGFNVTNEPVDDVYLRKAIAYSLDKYAMADHFKGERTYAPLPASHEWADYYAEEADIHKYEFDLDRAQEMIEQSDYDGETVTIKTSEGRQEQAQILQQMMNQVNINVDIEVLEWGTFYDDVVEGEAEIYLLGWFGIIDPDAYIFFHSEMTPDQGGNNRMFYENEEADELIEKGRQTLEPEERREVYADLFEVLTDDLPNIFLYSEQDMYAYQDNIEGFEVGPYPVTILNNLKDIEIVD